MYCNELSQEDQETITGNMHGNLVKLYMWFLNMLMDTDLNLSLFVRKKEIVLI